MNRTASHALLHFRLVNLLIAAAISYFLGKAYWPDMKGRRESRPLTNISAEISHNPAHPYGNLCFGSVDPRFIGYILLLVEDVGLERI